MRGRSVSPLCSNLHPALCLQKFYCVEWVQTQTSKKRASCCTLLRLGGAVESGCCRRRRKRTPPTSPLIWVKALVAAAASSRPSRQLWKWQMNWASAPGEADALARSPNFWSSGSQNLPLCLWGDQDTWVTHKKCCSIFTCFQEKLFAGRCAKLLGKLIET